MKIAIVDDDKKAAKVLADKLLGFEGVELCGIADNGLDGLRLMNEQQPDLLFLDIELPDISGIEFLERADCHPNGNCRVIMYTAHDRFMLSAFRNKAYDYLMKPIDDTELRAIMRRVCIDSTRIHNDDSSNETTTINPSDGITCRNDGKFIVYTNSVDFRLVDIREIGVFTYNHDLRLWELTLSSQKAPIRLKRNVNSDQLIALNSQFVRVSQKHIINIGYLMEVINNTCRFYPPFEKLENVKVGRLFRKKLIDLFCNL